MPRYDIECPNCGVYERATSIDDRKSPCDRCGAEVDVLISSSTTSKGFEPYFDIGLGHEVTGIGHRQQLMRQTAMLGEKIDYRDHPRPGDRSARLDRINEARKQEARVR